MKKIGAIMISLAMLISVASCAGGETKTSEQESSSENPSSNEEIKKTEQFIGEIVAGWDISSAEHPTISDGTLYFYDDNYSLYSYNTNSNAVEKLSDIADGQIFSFVSTSEKMVYGIKTKGLSTASSVQLESESLHFVNIVNDPSFQPITLPAERVSSAFILQGKLYFSNREGIQSVDLKTGESKILVAAGVQNGFVYDGGFIYYKDDYDNEQKNLLYRFPVSAPDQVETFDIGQEANLLFVLNGDIYVEEGSVNIGYSGVISKATWNGSLIPIFKDTVVESFQPYQDGLVALLKNTDGSYTLTSCNKEGQIIHEIVPFIGGNGSFVTFTSFGSSLFYQTTNQEGKTEYIYVDEKGDTTPITIS